MDAALYRRAAGGFAVLIVILGAALFIPAGTIRYWQAWVFCAIFSVWVLAITVYLARNDPKLLKRRINAGPAAEKETSQKIIQLFASLSFIAIFVVSAIDHRLGWSAVPVSVVVLGDALIALGFYAVFLVLRENTYAAGTIEVEQGQQVISTGPYALVRHPMYAGALIMLLGIPLALGSWWGLLTIVPMALVLVWRILEEEAFLGKNLSGYVEYRAQVKYRLVPLIW
ncbi:MAG TPA: isoprenylcysteine carboxylmethyltransferase family protein [Magnetospirillaceae bacterium]|nr:isoprenylcysteine carboxylmethyltransferase family protein [Magnetospirillaceae bacterium]